MSYVMGCPCGREKSEFSTCEHCARADCIESITEQLKDYAEKANRSERTMIAKNKYVWVKSSGEAKIIEEPVTLWLSDEFDKDEDRIYALGNEVEVNFSVDIKNKTSVWR